jgi:hypothetical protein
MTNGWSFKAFGLFGLVAVAFGATACGGEDDDDSSGPPAKAHIEIAGTWQGTDPSFPETDTIDDVSWATSYGDADPSLNEIVTYSNSDRSAVVKAPDDAAFNPSTFSKIVWTKVSGGSFYYCTASYGCASAALTETGDGDDEPGCEPPVADSAAPELAGCGASGFPWSKLTKSQ